MDIDREIAEKVMGLHVSTHDGRHLVDSNNQKVFKLDTTNAFSPCKTFHPSTNIADAWLVVERMEHNFWECEIYQGSAFQERLCKFWKSIDPSKEYVATSSNGVAEAICLAALKAAFATEKDGG